MMYRLLQPGIEVLVELSQPRFRARSRNDALHAGDVVLDEDKSRFFRVQRLQAVGFEGQRDAR